MKIGVIGSGQVAQVLASGFIKHGHEVMVGTRDTPKLKDWLAKESGKPKIGSMEDTANFGEIVVLAVKGTAAEALVKTLASGLKGKTVIDVVNPIADVPPVNGVLNYFTGPNDSLMERLQKIAPDAKFVKAFSCVGNA
ncbi:MAG: NAD(P)-binding domain-containing protein, partial [Bacteroidetes bacterium]|nr:NAD(P)-binding domain-containing protein [Bacteroidota bacterium]